MHGHAGGGGGGRVRLGMCASNGPGRQPHGGHVACSLALQPLELHLLPQHGKLGGSGGALPGPGPRWQGGTGTWMA